MTSPRFGLFAIALLVLGGAACVPTIEVPEVELEVSRADAGVESVAAVFEPLEGTTPLPEFGLTRRLDGVWFRSTKDIGLGRYRIRVEGRDSDGRTVQGGVIAEQEIDVGLNTLNLELGCAADCSALDDLPSCAIGICDEDQHRCVAGPDTVSEGCAEPEDDTPPVVAIVSPTDMAVLRPELRLEVEATDPQSEVSELWYQVDGGTRVPMTRANPDGEGTARFEANLELEATNGDTVTITAGATSQGGESEPVAVNIEIDTVAEPPTLTAPSAGARLNGDIAIRWTTNDANPKDVTVTYVSGLTEVAIFERIPDVGEVTWDSSAIAGDPAASIRVTATDVAGNEASVQSELFAIDNTAPSVRLESPTGGEYWRGEQTVRWVGDDDEALTRLEWSVDEGETWTALAEGQPSSGDYAWDTSGLEDSTVVIVRAVATDPAGNVSSNPEAVSGVFTIDHTAPAPSFTGALAGTVVQGDLTLTWESGDVGPGTAEIFVDYDAAGEPMNVAVDAPDTGTWLIDTTAYPDGANVRLGLVLTDAAGNIAEAIESGTFAIDNVAPEVQYVGPLEGTLLSGDVAVLWRTTEETPGAVDIEESRNGGSDWTTIASSEADDGEYPWDTRSIPEAPSVMLRITVRSAGELTGVVTSPALVLDNTPPQLTLTAPAEGALVGGFAAIRWETQESHPGNVRIEGSSDGGEWVELVTSTEDDGEADVNIEALGDTQTARLRLTASDTLGNSAAPVVSAAFTVDITAPELVMTAPSAGDLVAGLVSVEWSGGAPEDRVQVELSLDARETWNDLETDGDNDGSFGWDSATVADASEIWLGITGTDAAGNTGERSVAGPFGIDNVPPVVTLLAPAGDEVFADSIEVTWLLEEVTPGTVRIELNRDGGDDWEELESEAGESPYLWTVTGADTQSGRIRVTAASEGGLSGVATSGPFVIDRTAPEVVLVAPQARVSWGNGERTIEWTSDDANRSTAELRYRVGDGEFSNLVAETEDTGSFVWDTREVTEAFENQVQLELTVRDRAANATTVVSERFTVDNGPPEVRDDVRLDRGVDTLNLSWSAAEDPGGIAGYTVSGAGVPVTVGETERSVSISGLAPCTRFELELAAEDLAGNRGSIAVVTSTTGCGPDGTFDEAAEVTLPAGTVVDGALVADVDGDRNNDIVVVDAIAGEVLVMLATGPAKRADGGFEEADTYGAGVGAEPRAVVSEDFDEDNIPDLAVADHTGFVRLLRGVESEPRVPSGTFGAPSSFAAGDGDPVALVSGDFDANGIADLAVAKADPPSVAILLGEGSSGKGDGAFGTPSDEIVLASTPSHIETRDVNDDNILDLVVTRAGVGMVDTLLGSGTGRFGDGGFSAPTSEAVGPVDTSILAVGDVTGDRIADQLVAGSPLAVRAGGGRSVRPSGELAPWVEVDAGGEIERVLVEDMDEDGVPDLVSLDIAENVVRIHSGGDGFALLTEVATLDEVTDLDAGDFNGDGHVDLIAIGRAASGTGATMELMLGQGDGTTEATRNRNFTAKNAGVWRALALDLNEDGYDDYLFHPNGSGVYLRWGSASNVLTSGSSQGLSSGASAFATADFDNDDIPDIFMYSNGGAVVGYGEGANGRQSGFTSSLERVWRDSDAYSARAVADITGDGYVDLILGDLRGIPGAGQRTSNQTRTSANTPSRFEGINRIVFVDLDGDGILDTLALNGGDLERVFNRGGETDDGRITDAVNNWTYDVPDPIPLAGDARWLSQGDLDGDGLPDIAIAGGNSGLIELFSSAPE